MRIRRRGKKKVQCLESEYGEMHGSHGKRNNCLGMWLDYSIPGEVYISMGEYLRGVLEDFLEKITEIRKKNSTSETIMSKSYLTRHRYRRSTTQWYSYYSPGPDAGRTHIRQ